MLTFNLKKEWFEKIKTGEKTHEYRKMSPYWNKRINNLLKNATERERITGIKVCFCLGYPSKNDRQKRLFGKINRITQYVEGRKTDLKCNEYCYDIEFELMRGQNE